MKIIGIDAKFDGMRVSTGPAGSSASPSYQFSHMTQKVQNNIVPWLLSRSGAAYKRDDGPNVVKE